MAFGQNPSPGIVCGPHKKILDPPCSAIERTGARPTVDYAACVSESAGRDGCRGAVSVFPLALQRDDIPIGLIRGLSARIKISKSQHQKRQTGKRKRILVLDRAPGTNDAEHHKQATEKLGVGLEALNRCKGFRMVQSQLCLGPLKSINGRRRIERIKIVFLDFHSVANRRGRIIFDKNLRQQSRPGRERFSSLATLLTCSAKVAALTGS
jgi:hypothetical protein